MICPKCKQPVTADTIESAARTLEAWPEGTRAVFHSDLLLHGVARDDALAALVAQGYGRLWIDGEAVAVEEAPQPTAMDKIGGESVSVVVDRFAIGPERASRIREALERGFELGRGRVAVSVHDEERPPEVFDRRFTCRTCGTEYARPTPHLFSFNSPIGACPTCEGFGRVVDIDIDKVIPNKRLSLKDGAVAAWSTPAYKEFQRDFLSAASRLGYSIELPFTQLPEDAKKWVLEGDRENPGIRGFFKWLESKRYKTHVRILLARYRSYRQCPDCHGARLRPEALEVRIGRRNIADFCAMSIADLAKAIPRLNLDTVVKERVESVLGEVRARLAYLVEVGLGYLTLDRQARTLSGGEAQRIHLAAALGSSLTDTLYALDEPTVGLHPRDSSRLLSVLRQLTKMGNSVVIVEHDPTLIEGADHVVDLGPGGGARGGEVLYEGKPSRLPGKDSSTGRLLLIRTLHRQKQHGKRASRGEIVVRGAREHNLAIDRLEIPLGQLVCITGVSGSGKSTLVENVLYENYLQERGQGGQEAGACDSIDGFAQVEDVLMMSQAPIGRSLRSNPATYVKCYDDIRKLFAGTPAARRQKITPAAFSFNTVGGRCERCQGTGSITIEMHFMADIDVPCDECGGKRFKPRVLEIRYRDKNIAEVLAMTVDDACEFFAERVPVKAKLDSLAAVGLGYLTLGQSTSTLSGGEAQRLKLAAFLIEESRSRGSLFIFDEPTTGLHLADVHTLISVLDGLVARGHTALVVEHHTDFISHADWVIDLGPEGGDQGGKVIAQGTPLEVAEVEESHTGRELRALLGLKRRTKSRARAS